MKIFSSFLTAIILVTTKRHKNLKNNNDLSLWISEEQVRVISGISMEIYVIYNGVVSPILLDPNFEEHLQVVPAEVNYVNFTWKAGNKKYFYNFNRLKSFNEVILKSPVISIKTEGKIPKKPKEFSVFLICRENSSGNATFDISLLIENRKRKRLPGTPIKLKLKKECSRRGPDPQCDKKCSNRGWCNHEKICQCQDGYVGQYCHLALCYPQCMNGGNCTSPGTCNCPIGFQGKYCEGGICNEKCLNGGKCIQKDTCDCSKGFYGPRCEFSKCVVPCLNGGKCIGVNKCRCLSRFRGNHCEIEDF